MIFENIQIDGASMPISTNTPDVGAIEIYENSDHLIFRHIDVLNYPQADPCDNARAAIAIEFSSTWVDGDVNQYHVFYDINIDKYRCGTWPPDCESGGQGIVCIDGVDHVWILNSTFTDIAEDAIHVIGLHGRNDTSLKRGPHDGLPYYIYAGNNIFNRAGENAIDIKESNHIFFSQNTAWGFRDTDEYGWTYGASGQAVVINDEGSQNAGGDESAKNTWIMFNNFYDCVIGVSDQSGNSSYIVGNLIHNLVPRSGNYSYGVWVSKVNKDVLNAIEYIVNNTIENFYDQGIYVTNAYDSIVDNNIISTRQNSTGYHIRCVNITNDNYVRNNLLYDPISISIAGCTCSDCVSGQEPKFISSESNDYKLQGNSPAIDVGRNSDVYSIFQTNYGLSIKVDKDRNNRPSGEAWDIGAYEYVWGNFLGISFSGGISTQ